MNSAADEPYERFLRRLADETGVLEAVVEARVDPAGALTYEAWLGSLPTPLRSTMSPAETWSAGATAMFQALVERGYIAPHEVESALQATADVLTS